MFLPLLATLLLESRAASLRASAAATAKLAASTGRPNIENYAFERFVNDFGRSYEAGSDEYKRRLVLFQASKARIATLNSRELRTWTAGISGFMDWTLEERRRLLGYKPLRKFDIDEAPATLLQLASEQRLDANSSALGTSGGLSVDEGPAIRDQGNCGSCWAISAAEAVEARLHVQVSVQALINCVPNPQHCGGSGGCDGATSELAYAFMHDYGVPLEQDLRYVAANGACAAPLTTGLREYPSLQRVRLDSWKSLGSNQAEPLMRALVESGPAVVAVAADTWFDYDRGVFDQCGKDAVLSHAVLAKGFAQDGDLKYWLVQNSWGEEWGERGHIRVLRHDDDDHWCGVDRRPEEGLGCRGGPKEITVCGMCGILYAASIPIGAKLEGVADPFAFAQTS